MCFTCLLRLFLDADWSRVILAINVNTIAIKLEDTAALASHSLLYFWGQRVVNGGSCWVMQKY